MKLFFYAGANDLATVSLTDHAALVAALADPADVDNAATIARVTGKVGSLVQSDSGEPLELYFYDDASTVSAWATDSSVTLACGLGDPDPASAYTYAATTAFTISGNSRRGTLALNTAALRDAFTLIRTRYGATRSAQLTLHLRKTTGGVTETLALLPLTVSPGVLSGTPADLTGEDYVTTASARTGYVINVSGLTSLTGGGSAALDGLDSGSATYPVGCLVATTEAVTGAPDYLRHWRLKGTYIAASDVDNGTVKPVNSDATLNPVHWKLCA